MMVIQAAHRLHAGGTHSESRSRTGAAIRSVSALDDLAARVAGSRSARQLPSIPQPGFSQPLSGIPSPPRSNRHIIKIQMRYPGMRWRDDDGRAIPALHATIPDGRPVITRPRVPVRATHSDTNPLDDACDAL